MSPPHIKWLIDTKKRIKTAEGVSIHVWELKHIDDVAVLSAWATHFRNHYCADDMIDALMAEMGLTRAQFLTLHKFPSMQPPGPSVRAGDFAEILVADFIEYLEGYWCPRERFSLKWNQNESTKGSDVIGFGFAKKNGHSPSDEMYVLESKADLTGQGNNRLQTAVDDSAKDPVRHAASLNALKQRFLERKDTDSALRVQRFQNPTDNPYKFRSGAVLVCSNGSLDEELIKQTVCANHPNSGNLTLLIVRGETLMDLVHALYLRAANEA
jgi:hypothetical protein